MRIKEQEPLLSIVIPVYNAAPYLQDCLDSLRNQDYPHYEVWLINDGSTDNSAKILNKYVELDYRFHVIHTDNEGVSAARNLGINHAKGPWISFIDADDIVLPDYVSSFYSWYNSNDIVFFSLELFNDSNEIRKKIIEEQEHIGRDNVEKGLINLLVNKSNCEYLGFTVNKFFRKKIIEDYHIRFSVNLSFREDELFTTEYCQHINSFKAYSRVLYRYRIHSTESLSQRSKKPSEVSQYCLQLSKLCSSFTNKKLLSLEYNRAFNFIINSYSNKLSRQEKDCLFSILNYWIVHYEYYLKINKKIIVLSPIIHYFPTQIAYQLCMLLLRYSYWNNRKKAKEVSPGVLW